MSKQNVAIAVLFIISAVSAQAGSKINISDSDPIVINNQTIPAPITEINRNSSDVTTTPAPNSTTNGTTTTTKPTSSTEKPTTPTTPTTLPTSPTTAKTSTSVPTTIVPTPTSTVSPNATTVPTGKPTGAPPTTPVPSHRRFDGPSFIGGIVLALGLVAIGFVAFKFYKARTELNYHTL